MKDIKEIKNTELWIKEIVESGIDEQGRQFIRTRWRKSDVAVNLGSIRNPNKTIVAYKYVEKGEHPEGVTTGSILKEFFGG